jgi:flagellar biosynthesis/type III secretory pathway protein FliH
MRSAILRISTAALLVMGAASAQACVATRQYPYRYERHEGYERRAFDNGERDGYAKGIDDLRHQRRPDINRQRWYRNGDHDYDHHYGSRDAYRADYRRGFEQGYERAYRDGWRR